MKKNYLKVLGGFSIILATFPASAQEQTERTLDEVVVTASRSPRKQSEIGRVVRVIGAKQLAQSQGRTLPEVLNNIAGIQLSGAGNAFGSNISVFTRGASAGNTLILIDGVPVNNASGISGEYDISAFAIDQIERVEILRGVNSTLYGSDAVAGVINIITKQPKGNKLQADVLGTAGNYGSHKEAIGLNGSIDKTGIALNFANTSTKGFSVAKDNAGSAGFDKESDLTPLLLDLFGWGITDPGSLCWLNTPPTTAITNAKELLIALGAIEAGKITEHGKKIHRLPTHPRLANMLIVAKESGKLPLATDIAALLEERDPLDGTLAGTDLNLRIERLRRHRAEQRRDKSWEKIEKTAAAYRKLFDIAANNSTADAYDAGLLLAHAYPERIASAKGTNAGLFLLANGQSAVMNREDDLSHEPWLSIAQLDARKGQGKIFMAAPLNPKDLSHLAKETENIRWDSRKGQLLATLDLRIGSIMLQSKPLASPDKHKLEEVISEAVKAEGQSLLDFNEDVVAWQNRVLSLRCWNPEQTWPDVKTESLLKNNKTWLGPYFDRLRKTGDFKKVKLIEVLQHALQYEQQAQLNKLAPEAIPVPSGSNIKLNYSPSGEAPVLAVRLQELFGMLDTPKVNGGTKNVVIHLLSPGYKPVQVTTDLRSFWQNTYFEVRKELKRRYHKHSWPENPLQAEAVRGVKKR